MTPTQAAFIATRARKLVRAGRLTHHDYAVFDALLWAGRSPGADRATASYSRLQQLAHVARATVAKAIASLEALGLIRKLKSRVLLLWHNGGRAWRQLTTCYVFHCEFTARTEYKKERIQMVMLEAPSANVRAAQLALAGRRRAVEASLLNRGFSA